jgi:Ala-tRNA(Pro) deacylase
MSLPQWLAQFLDRHGVAYETLHHPPVFGALRLAEAEHVSGHRVVKTVFLADRGHPVAVVLPAAARLNLERVQAVVGSDQVRLATEDEIAGWFKGCPLGAIPPLRLRSDERILMDRALARLGPIVFAAGTTEDAVAMSFRDWYRLVRPGVGHFAQADGQAAPAAPPSVLVIEDEPDTNQLLCALLEQQGFRCRGAAEGTRALVLASEMRPSAILLDLMLPDMSGFDLYERLCRVGPLKRTPVLVVSALDNAGARTRGQQMGVDAYLTKPFMPDSLVAELQEVLSE